MESRQSNSSSAEAKHLGPEASADELARAVDRSPCERSSGIMTDCLCEPAMRMGGSACGTEDALADGVLIADGLDGRPLAKLPPPAPGSWRQGTIISPR